MPDDFASLFLQVAMELRERNLSRWERLVAEEILLRTYGRNKASVPVRRLDDLAAFFGLSRGNLHSHVEALLRYEVLGCEQRRDKKAFTWWVKGIGLWKIGRRIEPDTERARRSERAEADLQEIERLLSNQHDLPGFEPEQTTAEVNADAELERADHGPTSNLSAAASAVGSLAAGNPFQKVERVPESGTGNPFQKVERVPESGTGSLDNAPAYRRARPGFPEARKEARLAGPREGAGEEKAGGVRKWRALLPGEAALLQEIEAWFADGGDSVELIAEYRPRWEGRIRAGSGLVERVFRDLQLQVREDPDLVKKSRGGLLKVRYDDWLRRQPPKVRRAPVKAAALPPVAAALAVAEQPAISWEAARERAKGMGEELRRRLRGGGEEGAR